MFRKYEGLQMLKGNSFVSWRSPQINQGSQPPLLILHVSHHCIPALSRISQLPFHGPIPLSLMLLPVHLCVLVATWSKYPSSVLFSIYQENMDNRRKRSRWLWMVRSIRLVCLNSVSVLPSDGKILTIQNQNTQPKMDVKAIWIPRELMLAQRTI